MIKMNETIKYSFVNDIIFGLVMQDEKTCKQVLQRILPKRKIGEVHIAGDHEIMGMGIIAFKILSFNNGRKHAPRR